MTNSARRTAEPEPTRRATQILALFVLASSLVFLAGMAVLTGTRCTTIFGYGSSLSLPEMVLSAGSALAFALLGALIIAYQPDNRIGWLCGAVGVTFALAQFAGTYANCAISGDAVLPAVPSMAWLAYLAFPAAILMMFSLLPFLFPDGRFFSPAWRWLALITVTMAAASVLLTVVVQGLMVHSATGTNYAVDNSFGVLPASFGPLLQNLMLLALVAASLTGIASLVVRVRRSQGVMRQQLKLLLYFLAVAISIQLAVELYGALVDEAIFSTWIYWLVVALPFWGFPAMIGVAVFKYRLYDIDIVIRKTLVYAVLTGLLALVYFGSVILLQGLFSRLAGVEQSTLAVVISTLAIAALFTPLRRRIQDAIDRRFFRKKYDAQQVLARFAQTARDETDLDALLAELARVVDETLQPEHVSVWLRKQEAPKSATASSGLTERR
jgi:hypothetical protein